MQTYYYWDNSKNYHGQCVFQSMAPDVLTADADLLQRTGILAVKEPSISVATEWRPERYSVPWSPEVTFRKEPRYRKEDVVSAAPLVDKPKSPSPKLMMPTGRNAMLHRIFLSKCLYCEKDIPLGFGHADHLVPKSKGGPDGIPNRVLACHDCDQSKGSRYPSLQECLKARKHYKAARVATEHLDWFVFKFYPVVA